MNLRKNSLLNFWKTDLYLLVQCISVLVVWSPKNDLYLLEWNLYWDFPVNMKTTWTKTTALELYCKTLLSLSKIINKQGIQDQYWNSTFVKWHLRMKPAHDSAHIMQTGCDYLGWWCFLHKGDIVKITYEHILVEDARTYASTGSRLREFGI